MLQRYAVKQDGGCGGCFVECNAERHAGSKTDEKIEKVPRAWRSPDELAMSIEPALVLSVVTWIESLSC